MTRPVRAALRSLAVTSMLVAAAVGAEEYDPYKVAREKFRADVKTIAIRPLRVSLADVDGEALANQVIERIGVRLREKGYVVVDPDEFDRRWRDFSEALGGVWDPQTGRVDTESHKLVWEYTTRDLSTQLGVDAILRPSFFSRVARVGWSGGKLQAVGEHLTWGGQQIDWGEGFPNWPQLVNAVWFGLDIQSIEGVELYDVGYPVRWSAIYMARSLEVRPEAEVYDTSKVLGAIERCLEDLETRE